MNKKALTLLILLGLFLLSVVIRLPQFNRPLSKHHEFCTAIALRIISSWQENGIQALKYKPGTNFGLPQDKFINNYASASGKIKDAAGNYYYLSHPPMAYYIPYYLFSLFKIKASVPAIQLYNMFLHFICAVTVFFIVAGLYKKEEAINLPAIIAFAVYLFNPATLWFQGNVYMSDMMVQLPFVLAVLVVTKMLLYEHHLLKMSMWLLLCCFIMVYTSWLGIFFCITLLLLMFRGKLFMSLALVEIIITALTLGLGITFLQYSKIAGMENLKEELWCRFAQRSSFHGWQVWLVNIFGIVKNYLFNYASLYVFLFVTAGAVLFVRKRIRPGNVLRNVLVISVLPIILLHLFLSDYSGHDFTVLYAAVPLSIIAGFFTERLYMHTRTIYIIAGTILFIVFNTAQFYYINRPGEISQSGDRYDMYLKEGE